MNRQEAAHAAMVACLECGVASRNRVFCSDTCQQKHFDTHFDIWVETDSRLRIALNSHLCSSCGTHNSNSETNCRACGQPWEGATDWNSKLNAYKQSRPDVYSDEAFIDWLIEEWRKTPESKEFPLAIAAIEDHIQDQIVDREDLALSIWLDCAVEGVPIAIGEYHAKQMRLKRAIITFFGGMVSAGILLTIGWQLILQETSVLGNLAIEICAWGVALIVAGSGWRLNRLFKTPDPRTFRREDIETTRTKLLEDINGWGEK